MEFMELKERFLLSNPDYANDVNNFLNYMQIVREFKLPAQQDFMVNGMNTEQVIESLKYYVDLEQIKKKEPAKKYFVSIKQLFEYVLNNSEYQNDDFLRELANPANREKSYSRKTNDFINEYDKLKDKDQFLKLEYETLCKLIDWCNIAIDKIYLGDQEIDETEFRRFSAALCMKLIILTGVTYREARKLKINDLDAFRNTVVINDLRIRLPLTLSVQFQKYERYHRHFIKSEFLFVDSKGNQWGEATSDSGIPNFMRTAIQQTNLTGIVKYGITQLIKSGVNDSIIMKLTGASRELLNSCLIDVQSNNLEWEQYINSKIVTTECYYQL